jgi:putative glycosyltransferase (TIGR04372 family)
MGSSEKKGFKKGLRVVAATNERVLSGRVVAILAVPVTLVGVAGLLVLTPIMNRLSRSPIYFFNQTALGHSMFEFITFWNEELRTTGTEYARLWYFTGKSRPINNAHIFIWWERLTRPCSGVSWHQLSPLTWSTLTIFLKVARQTPRWIIPLNPNYSKYTSLSKSHTRRLMTVGEDRRLMSFLENAFGFSVERYCVLGIRDGNFYQDQTLRDSSIAAYLPAINLILEKGIPVVRMGRRAKEPLPLDHPLVFDYSFSGEESDTMDVLLWANADFAVGDATGLTDAVALLGSPIVVPTHPMDPRAFLSNENYYFATQHLMNDSGEILSIQEIVGLMNCGVQLHSKRELDEKGITTVMPSASTIADTVNWFLRIVLDGDRRLLEHSRRATLEFASFMALNDEAATLHYRRDSFRGSGWLSMKSTMFPESAKRGMTSVSTDNRDLRRSRGI